jgi:hypothetical protein
MVRMRSGLWPWRDEPESVSRCRDATRREGLSSSNAETRMPRNPMPPPSGSLQFRRYGQETISNGFTRHIGIGMPDEPSMISVPRSSGSNRRYMICSFRYGHPPSSSV